jgi:hypothetical protein
MAQPRSQQRNRYRNSPIVMAGLDPANRCGTGVAWMTRTSLAVTVSVITSTSIYTAAGIRGRGKASVNLRVCSCVLQEEFFTAEHAETKMQQSYGTPLSSLVIGAAIEVRRQLGPGRLESSYKECQCFELARHCVAYERQLPLPIIHKGYKLDLVVERTLLKHGPRRCALCSSACSAVNLP